MKRNSKLIALVASLFAITITSAVAIAQPPQGPQGPRGEGRGKGPLFHCLQIVNLTEDQKTQIGTILETAQPTLQALREDVREAREAVRALMDAGDAEACEVGAAVLAVHDATEVLHAEMQKVMESVKLVLTPEQIAKLEGCLEGARDDFPGRGNGPGGPGGN